MPKLFTRILTFKVEGEIYDNETKPEDIIKGYDWSFEDSMDGNIQIFGHHKDNRGIINSMIKLPKIHKWKTPDTEFFLI